MLQAVDYLLAMFKLPDGFVLSLFHLLRSFTLSETLKRYGLIKDDAATAIWLSVGHRFNLLFHSRTLARRRA